MVEKISGVIIGKKLDEMNQFLKVMTEKIKQGTFNNKIYIQILIKDFLQTQKIITFILDLKKKITNLKYLFVYHLIPNLILDNKKFII